MLFLLQAPFGLLFVLWYGLFEYKPYSVIWLSKCVKTNRCRLLLWNLSTSRDGIQSPARFEKFNRSFGESEFFVVQYGFNLVIISVEKMLQRDGPKRKAAGLEASSSGFVTVSRGKDSRISDSCSNFIDFNSTFFELLRELLSFFCHAVKCLWRQNYSIKTSYLLAFIF